MPTSLRFKHPIKDLSNYYNGIPNMAYLMPDLGNREDILVSIDRLKTAFIEEPLRSIPEERNGAYPV